MPVLSCLKCATVLDRREDACVCPQCHSEWPITDGIPRFFRMPTHYWGEIGRNEARELLEAARKGSWRDTVLARFVNDRNMKHGLLDLQRASWAPMLGLHERSVVLDIGSGYGAITHSLAESAGEVYSVEAVTERIEFTQERLRQEGLRNVSLIQASATALPLAEKSFDVVVTNGVLEWVGEWDLDIGPREVQINFLRKIASLLKDDGVLVIGIENRIGYGLFLGHRDHSGMRYTTMVPRRVASFMLRHKKGPNHRRQLNLKKEYRTYTYSENGYRKLLAESGLPDVSAYWANPSYNQPYCLVPLAKPGWVKEHFITLLDHPSPAPRRSWRRTLKRAVVNSPLLPRIMPDFLLFASKSGDTRTEVQSWLEARYRESCGESQRTTLPARIPWALYTQPLRPKSIVRVTDPATGEDFAYIKVHVTTHPHAANPEVEPANREKIRTGLESSSAQFVRVPRSIDTLRLGDTFYSMESAANGEHLCRKIRQLGYFDNEVRVKNDLTRIFNGITELTAALRKAPGVKPIPPAWLRIPEELDDKPEISAAIEKARYFSDGTSTSRVSWIQHGDFSVENICFDQKTGRIEVFDWVDLAAGLPPLYDVFHLLLSTGYLPPGDETKRFAGEVERWLATFNAILLNDSPFARIARECVVETCKQLVIAPTLIPDLLLESLLIRANYYRVKSPAQRRVHVRVLEEAVERGETIFGRFRRSAVPVESRVGGPVAACRSG